MNAEELQARIENELMNPNSNSERLFALSKLLERLNLDTKTEHLQESSRQQAETRAQQERTRRENDRGKLAQS